MVQPQLLTGKLVEIPIYAQTNVYAGSIEEHEEGIIVDFIARNNVYTLLVLQQNDGPYVSVISGVNVKGQLVTLSLIRKESIGIRVLSDV